MKLTPKEAFEAMTMFLDMFYNDTQSDDVGALLGGMTMNEDGQTFDPAYWHEWMECIQRVKGETPSE